VAMGQAEQHSVKTDVERNAGENMERNVAELE
jgi:hypothetical protein